MRLSARDLALVRLRISAVSGFDPRSRQRIRPGLELVASLPADPYAVDLTPAGLNVEQAPEIGVLHRLVRCIAPGCLARC
jgi:hypothetical protein